MTGTIQLTCGGEHYVCNACGGKVRFDPDARFRCSDPDCEYCQPDEVAAFVHVGADCGHYGFAVGPIQPGGGS